MSYEQYRRWIILTFPDGGRGPVLDLVAGSLSGGTAVLFTYPLDLVRTKLAYQVNVEKGNRLIQLSLKCMRLVSIVKESVALYPSKNFFD